MHCERRWRTQEALNAIRSAIFAGRVSSAWTEDGFPRYVWHKEGNVWYEARTEDRKAGEYHGHPVEEIGVPVELRR